MGRSGTRRRRFLHYFFRRRFFHDRFFRDRFFREGFFRRLDRLRLDASLGHRSLDPGYRLGTRRLRHDGGSRFHDRFESGRFFNRRPDGRSIAAAREPTANFQRDIIVERAGMRLFVADA
jgi:hypothetical protein